METALIKTVEKIYSFGKDSCMDYPRDVLGDICLIQRRFDLNYNMAIIFCVAVGLQINEASCSPNAVLAYLGLDKWESLAIQEDFLSIFKNSALVSFDSSSLMEQAFTVNREVICGLSNPSDPSEYIKI